MMQNIVLRGAILGGILAATLYTAPAQAQATRTWVSGVGDDANPCSRTAPCKTFAGAISKTATAGEINCLDPGGFGGVTITKSIMIDCHEVFASILVSGTPGITINAAGGTVTLRNLNLDGVTTGTNGINILSATTVNLEDLAITGFAQSGIRDARAGGGTKLFIRNTTIRNNTAPGIVSVAVGTNSVVVDQVHAVNNTFGIAVGTGNNVMINRSVFSGNSSAGIEADAGAQVNVDSTVVSHNATGIQANGTVRLANTDISFNTTAISGATTSFGNNRISGNSVAGTAPSAAGGPTNFLGTQ